MPLNQKFTDQLYREQLLEHFRQPKNKGLTNNPDMTASKINVFCGDKFTVQVNINDNNVVKMRFDGSGCAISVAAASLLSEYVVGSPISLVLSLGLKDIEKMLGTNLSHMRIKCGLLALETMQEALISKKTDVGLT